mmetsp:Transcript_1759/g.5097  ORF Transcript_1759/g.5097 Transcript_1759/m.5097 type:complete len:245 (+) Transcript_1759:393-1127(+)
MGLLLVVQELPLELELPVHLFHCCHARFIGLPVVFLDDRPLLGRRVIQGLDHQPAALVVFDVGARLANHHWVPETIQVVVLNLKVLAHAHADVFGQRQRLVVPHPAHQQAACDGQVEGVEGRFVRHDAHVRVYCVPLQVHCADGCGDEVHQLSVAGLMRRLVEEFQQLCIVGLVSKVALQHPVHARLQHYAVVDGHQPHLGNSVPAGLAATCDAVVHHVIRHQEECLQPLDTPAQDVCLKSIRC